ncbi:Uncharacterized protein QTN25_009839 [Entamoeba marina]
MKKSKHPLFVLLELATKDDNPMPNVKMFDVIVDNFNVSLDPNPILDFVTLSMKAHSKHFVSTLAMYYNLCLVEYLAIKTDFKCRVNHKNFFEAFESLAQLDGLIGHFRSKPSLLQRKCIALINILKETCPVIKDIYLKYLDKGISFTSSTMPYYATKSPKIICDGILDGGEIYQTIPSNIMEMIAKMSNFRELATEPLKKSNLIRNGKLQTKHLRHINIAFLSEANRLLSKYHSLVSTVNFSEEDEAIIWEESRKTSHIMHVFQHETRRIKKIEKKISKELKLSNSNSLSSSLVNHQSLTIRALLSSLTTYPKTRSSATRINDIISKSHARSVNSKEESRTSTDSPTPLNNQIPVIPSFKPDSAKKDKIHCSMEISIIDLLIDEGDDVKVPPKLPPDERQIKKSNNDGGLNADKVINDIIKNVLALQVNKTMLTRKAINKTIFDKHKVSSRNYFDVCMKRAKSRLLDEFGFELKEVHTNKTQTHYILIDHPNDSNTTSIADGMSTNDKIQHGIILIVMALIWLNNEPISLETMLTHLNDLDVVEIPGFDGTLTDFINNVMVKQKYIKKQRVETENDKIFQYTLGIRAYSEIGKDGLCSWIAKVHGEVLEKEELELLKEQNKRILEENYDDVEDVALIPDL